MPAHLKVLAALSIGLLTAALGDSKPLSAAEPSPVTAIDILLEPDQTMVEHAVAANKRLLGVFPKGFALGKTHAPHISTLQRYVNTADLDKIYAAVAKVLAEEKPATWKLKAYKYYYIPWKDIGLAGIVIEPTADLVRYQQKLIDAVTPFTVKTGTAAAFAVFEPAGLAAMWDEGVAVHGAARATEIYWEQTANFGRKYLANAEGLDRIAELGEKVIAAAPGLALPLYAGWRAMPLVPDAPGRALQVMFVLRELRAAVHFNALSLSGIAPVEAHMLNKGPEYTSMFGWPQPYPDGADKKERLAEVERRRTHEVADVLDQHEAILRRIECRQRLADHLRVEVAALPRVHLDGGGAGGADAVRVERGLLVAFHHHDGIARLQRVDGAHEQRRLARARARHEVERERAAVAEELAVARGEGVVAREDVLLDRDDPRRAHAVLVDRPQRAGRARCMFVRIAVVVAVPRPVGVLVQVARRHAAIARLALAARGGHAVDAGVAVTAAAGRAHSRS